MLKANALYWPSGEVKYFIDYVAQVRIHGSTATSSQPIWFSTGSLKKGFSKMSGLWTRTSERLPGEFLHQGSAFDRYGNNSVTNNQWTITIGEEDWSRLSPSGLYAETIPTTGHWWREPLSKVGVLELSARERYLVTDGAYGEILFGYNSSSSTYSWSCRRHSWESKYVDRDADGVPRYVTLEIRNYVSVRKTQGKYQMESNANIIAVTPKHTGEVTLLDKRTFSYVSKAVFDALRTEEGCRAFSSSLELPTLPEGWREKLSGKAAVRYATPLINPYEGLDGVSFDIDLDFDGLYRDFNLYAKLVERRFTDQDRSDVAADIMQSINLFDGNMIAYARDLPKIGDSIRSILSLVRNYKNPAAWASTWLSLRFADRLTIADTSELLAAFRRDISAAQNDLIFYRSTRHYEDSGIIPVINSAYTTSSRLCACIALSGGLEGDLENLLAAPFRWDLLPTLQNVWDMIPFSFVVDWVYDVEAILTQIDLMAETRTIDIKTQYASTRYETTLSLDALTFGRYHGTVTHTWYERNRAQVDTWLRLRAFSEYLATSVRPVNMIDSAGLLVQSRF